MRSDSDHKLICFGNFQMQIVLSREADFEQKLYYYPLKSTVKASFI